MGAIKKTALMDGREFNSAAEAERAAAAAEGITLAAAAYRRRESLAPFGARKAPGKHLFGNAQPCRLADGREFKSFRAACRALDMTENEGRQLKEKGFSPFGPKPLSAGYIFTLEKRRSAALMRFMRRRTEISFSWYEEQLAERAEVMNCRNIAALAAAGISWQQLAGKRHKD